MIVDSRSKPLNHSEERYRFLFEFSPAAVYSIDASGVIQDFNLCAAELWGRSPQLGDTDERFCGSQQMFRPDGSFMPHDECPMAKSLPERYRRSLTEKWSSFALTVRESRRS